MMRANRWAAVVGLAVLAVLAGSAGARPREGGGTKEPAPNAPVVPKVNNDCDMAGLEKAPWCTKCNKLLEKDEVDKGKHKECDTAPTMITVCVKTMFVCTTCGKSAKAAGKCPTDKVDMVKQVSKARMIYRCPVCKEKGEKPGACTGATCKGKALVPSCELSGMVPHCKVWPNL
jgi:hypothetical protein